MQEQERNSIIWHRRLDGDSEALTSGGGVSRLQCAPASCPARFATTPPRRMMWPLRQHRHIDSVYSYTPARSRSFHLPPPPSSAQLTVTSATLTTTTSDVTSHTVILWRDSVALKVFQVFQTRPRNRKHASPSRCKPTGGLHIPNFDIFGVHSTRLRAVLHARPPP